MLADDIIAMIYGDGYASSAAIFRIFIASMPFMFLSMQFNYALGAIKLQGLVLKIIMVLLLVNIVVNIAIIPGYGIKGAACVTFLTEFIGFAILLGLTLKYFRISGALQAIKLIILPLCVMVTAVFILSRFGVIIAISAGAISYLGALCIVGRKVILPFLSIMKSGR